MRIFPFRKLTGVSLDPSLSTWAGAFTRGFLSLVTLPQTLADFGVMSWR
jgi:hypothetical protein